MTRGWLLLILLITFTMFIPLELLQIVTNGFSLLRLHFYTDIFFIIHLSTTLSDSHIIEILDFSCC